MVKKSSKNARNAVHRASEVAENPASRLDIKQIRRFSDSLTELPDGAPMPDLTDLTVGDRLHIAALLIPKDQRDEVMGVKSEFALVRYRTGTAIPLDVVAAIAAETEIPLDWFVTGKAMDRKAPLVRITPDNPQADPDDVPLQKLAFKAAAGRGALILDELADHVRFPRAILSHVGIEPQHARLMEASGESMRETISDGDLLLVDVSQPAKQVVEGKIYVFALGNEAYVKRLRRAGDRFIMISDNKDLFPAEEVPQHSPMQIFGRVKWTGRSL